MRRYSLTEADRVDPPLDFALSRTQGAGLCLRQERFAESRS
jgi:hypothetical protein